MRVDLRGRGFFPPAGPPRANAPHAPDQRGLRVMRGLLVAATVALGVVTLVFLSPAAVRCRIATTAR